MAVSRFFTVSYRMHNGFIQDSQEVENGEIQYPVSEITIAGNLKDMWRNIVTVGNDIETRSNIQCGSVLLPEMKIAGQ